MAAGAVTESPASRMSDKDDERKASWWGMRSERTKAMPKQSLFGTTLENVDRETLKGMEGHYIPEGHINYIPDRYPLPDHVKQAIPGREALETSRQNVIQHQNLLSETDRELKKKAVLAFGFKGTGSNMTKTAGSERSGPSWLTRQDLEHAEEINIVGLNDKGSYNRDKYGTKPRRHKYSLVGDVLAKDMDFSTTKQMDDRHVEAMCQKRERAYGPGRHLPYDLMAESSEKKKIPAKSVVDLPANIRHTFGSRVCDNLLSDQQVVTRALERQHARSGPPRPSKKDDVKGLPVNLDNVYESIGQATRYNVFPGLTTEHTLSRTKNDFNDEVHKRRVPCTDEFRYQRDELSIWVEQDVLRKRMQGQWTNYFQNLPKFAVSWDRSATRPPPQVVKSAPKPRPKPKPKPRPEVMSAPLEPEAEEIVFVTPPLTPPPPIPEYVEAPKEFQKDDEFWKFFDNPLPK